MAEPVPDQAGEPEPLKRPVVSPVLDPAWQPGPRSRVQQVQEERAFWRLESSQYVLVLMALVAVVMLVMFGMLLLSFYHAAHTSSG